MKISVIVPVYNADRYLDDCINSILNQTLEDFELILVDDGSTDKSGEICDRFAENCGKIVVIHKPNGGPSSARNKGMDVASGEYVAFVDSDDYIEPDYLACLYKTLIDANADFAVSGYFCENCESIMQNKAPICVYTQTQYIAAVVSNEIPNISAFGPCGKLFKKNILDKNNIRFDERFKLGEDRVFNINVIANVNTVASTDYIGYHYIDNPLSLTHNKYDRSIVKKIIEVETLFCQNFERTVQKAGVYDDYKIYLKKARTYTVLSSAEFIKNSKNDGSGITKKYLYKLAFPVAKDSVLTEDRNNIVWKILDFSIINENVFLFRAWCWFSKLKQKIKRFI